MGIFDSLYNKPPVAKKEFTPRDNSSLGLSKSGSSLGMFPRKEPIAKGGNAPVDKKTESKYVFYGQNSAPARNVIKDFVTGNGMKEHFKNDLGTKDRMGKTGVGIFGKEFVRKDDIYAMKKAIIDRKIDRIKGLPPEMRRKMMNDSGARQVVIKNLDRMLGKKQ